MIYRDFQKTCDYFREEENLKSNPTTDIAINSCESSDVHGEAGPVTSEKEAVDFENLKTLEEDGIDVSFLERMKVAALVTLKPSSDGTYLT